MKIIYLLFIAIALKNECYSQKVDRFCIISFNLWWPKHHPSIEIDLGKSSISKDSTTLSSLQPIYQSKSPTDILNEMTLLGWTFINSSYSNNLGFFTFKRPIEKSEVSNK